MLFRSFRFSVDDQCLFLPPLSEKEDWQDLSELYSQMGVVIQRYRSAGDDHTVDEYDVVFNIRGTATVVEQVPGVYLKSLSQA